MDSTTVYAKTPIGQEEVATRARHVPARVRAMLIMVDGHRSVGELLANHPAAEEARGYLATLLDGGFIAEVGGGAGATATAPAADAGAGLASAKRTVVQTLIEFLGPDADVFAMRVEAVATHEQLAAECEMLCRMLEGSVGHGPAERFRETVFPLLQ